MNEQQALDRMIAPGTRRSGKYREGVIQIHVTRTCNMSCYNCTQGSNYRGKTTFITPEQFEQAVLSLFPKNGTGTQYFGVCGIFGGNPALHPQFEALCDIMRKHVPFNQRGIWCNDPMTVDRARMMRETFDPSVSNLNVHLDQIAYNTFKNGWPECHPVGLQKDSRHAPVFVAMKDVLWKVCPTCNGLGDDNVKHEFNKCDACNGTGKVYDEEKAWELISDCPINKHWSAMVCVVRNELRAFFCEIAGSQAMLKQDDPSWPDTGIPVEPGWWKLPMQEFADQVRWHCHRCSVPLQGYGELAQSEDPEAKEQFSETYSDVCKPKRTQRQTEIVTTLHQLGIGRLKNMTDYLGNAKR